MSLNQMLLQTFWQMLTVLFMMMSGFMPRAACAQDTPRDPGVDTTRTTVSHNIILFASPYLLSHPTRVEGVYFGVGWSPTISHGTSRVFLSPSISCNVLLPLAGQARPGWNVGCGASVMVSYQIYGPLTIDVSAALYSDTVLAGDTSTRGNSMMVGTIAPGFTLVLSPKRYYAISIVPAAFGCMTLRSSGQADQCGIGFAGSFIIPLGKPPPTPRTSL